MTGLRGRVTLYGEYLMHGICEGYCFPTPWTLAASGHDRWYRPTEDSAGTELRRLGYRTAPHISGTLPVGYGFAGSTVLSLLHLADQAPDAGIARARVQQVDRLTHGFEPSGLDYHAISAQRPGFYCCRTWRPAPDYTGPSYFWLPPREDQHPLGAIGQLLRAQAGELAPLCRQLTAAVEAAEPLDDLLYRYCQLLLQLGVYSPLQQQFVAAAVEAGIIAKGIGGLYGKAVLLVGAEAVISDFAASRDAQLIGAGRPAQS